MARVQVDWHGSFAVIVTPFTADGGIDEAAYRRVVDLVLEAGCHGVIAGGSTGEFFLMTPEERKRVFALAAEQAAGRVPVIACPAAIRTEDVVALTQAAATAGCDGVMVLPPVYVANSQAELDVFFRRVAGEGGLPVMLYNSPRFVNSTLAPELVLRLMEEDNVVAIKDTTFDLYTTSALVRACGPELKVFIGLEDLLVPALSIGAVGAVAMLPQVLGAMAVELYDAAVAGDKARAQELHHKVARAYDLFKLGGGYVAVKEAMNLLGKPGGHSRPPMLPLTEPERDQLRAILRDVGVLD
ncbi:MAG: dihydrodipicolinate synthase family protein [Rhodospirillales bacterium]|nr:dihydrodipicolinate synthase family protein [Rhodospirillales bacterium]